MPQARLAPRTRVKAAHPRLRPAGLGLAAAAARRGPALRRGPAPAEAMSLPKVEASKANVVSAAYWGSFGVSLLLAPDMLFGAGGLVPYFSVPIAEPMAVFFARAFGAVMTGLGLGGYAFLDQKAAATNKVRVQVREREGLGLTMPVQQRCRQLYFFTALPMAVLNVMAALAGPGGIFLATMWKVQVAVHLAYMAVMASAMQ